MNKRIKFLTTLLISLGATTVLAGTSGIDQRQNNQEGRIEQGVRSGELTAGKVILALPRLALETLFVRSNVFNLLANKESAQLWNTLQTATNQPLEKINLYYDQAWWGNETLTESGAVAFGPNFADLPVGSIYPFYSISNELAAALEYQDYMEASGQAIPPYAPAK